MHVVNTPVLGTMFQFVRRTPNKSRDCARARNATEQQRRNPPHTHETLRAGGALRACDNDLLPEPEDRNGRHWMRVELNTVLMRFAFEISVQLWSRRDSSGAPPL